MTDAQRAQIKTMLAAGATQEAVSQETGVSKSCVGKFAKRHGLGRRGPAGKRGARLSTAASQTVEVTGTCPVHRAYLPCVACRAIVWMRAQGRNP